MHLMMSICRYTGNNWMVYCLYGFFHGSSIGLMLSICSCFIICLLHEISAAKKYALVTKPRNILCLVSTMGHIFCSRGSFLIVMKVRWEKYVKKGWETGLRRMHAISGVEVVIHIHIFIAACCWSNNARLLGDTKWKNEGWNISRMSFTSLFNWDFYKTMSW